MVKIGLLVMMSMFGILDYAQEGHFVLIQSENHQPFYVRLGDQIYSSSPQGHLILARLKDSIYSITIGFPGQPSTDQRFTWKIQQDQELQLKSLGDKGWGLLNVLTNDLKMADLKEPAIAALQPKGIKKDDAFSRLMAGVVADTAVMYNTYALAEQADSGLARSEPVGIKSPARSDSTIFQAPGQPVMGQSSTGQPTPGLPIGGQPVASLPIKSEPGKNEPAKIDPTKNDPAKAAPVNHPDVASATHPAVVQLDSPDRTDSMHISSNRLVKPKDSAAFLAIEKVAKISERRTSKGLRMVYTIGIHGQKLDTVDVVIPPDNSKGASTTTKARATSTTVSTASVKTGILPDSSRAAGDSGAARKSTAENSAADKAATEKSATEKTAMPFVNSDCHDFATDYDVDKLRVKMLQAAKDEDRILVARKVFRSKCFSSKQIKALTELFTSDEMKFRLLETAYPFASDGAFKDLSELLTDPVYNNKFKVMTGGR